MEVTFSRTTVKILRGGLAASFFLPLLYTRAVLFPGHFEKWIAFFLLVDALAIIFLIAALRSRRIPVPRDPFMWGLLAYITLRFLFTFISEDAQLSLWGSAIRMTGTLAWAHFFIFFILLTTVLAGGHPRWLYRSAACSLIIASVSAFFIGSNPGLESELFGQQGRLTGLFASSTYFASYLLPGFFLLLGGIAHEKRLLPKILILIAAGLTLGALVGSGTRGAEIGLAVGAAVVLVVWLLFKGGRAVRRLTLAIVIGALIAAIVYMVPREDRPRALQSFFAFPYEALTDPSVRSRFILWDIAVRAFVARPLIGWGPENFVYAFDAHYAPALMHLSFQETWADRPHNAMLEALVSQGVWGGAAYLVLYGSLVVAALIAVRRARIPPLHAAALCGLVVGHAVESSFTFELPGALFFVAVAGATASSVYPVRTHTVGTLGRVACVAALVAVGGYMWYGVLRPLRSVHAAARLQDAFIEKSYSALPRYFPRALEWQPYAFDVRATIADDILRYTGQGVLPREVARSAIDVVFASLDDTVSRLPRSFGAALRRAQFAMRKFELTKGSEWADTFAEALAYARKLSPERQALTTAAFEFALVGGDIERARGEARALIASDPSVPLGHWLLGIAYGIENPESSEGAFHLLRAVRLGFVPRKRPDIELVAHVLTQAKEWDLLFHIFTDLIGREPQNPEWYFRRGIVYARMGRLLEARGDLLHAIELDPAYREGAEALLRQFN